jgi:hypothetical protein
LPFADIVTFELPLTILLPDAIVKLLNKYPSADLKLADTRLPKLALRL